MYDQVTLGLNVDPFILSALKEDITSEDVSTNSVMPHPQAGEVDLICKQDGIIMAHNNLDGYYTAGKDYTLSAKVKNFGTKAVTSFNTDINIDGKTVALKVENVNIQPGASYSITLPELSTTTSGNTPISISVNNVNNADDDDDMSDNTYTEPTQQEQPTEQTQPTQQEQPTQQ